MPGAPRGARDLWGRSGVEWGEQENAEGGAKSKILLSFDTYTVKNGKKHGLLVTAKGKSKKVPDYYMFYVDDDLVESGNSIEELIQRVQKP